MESVTVTTKPFAGQKMGTSGLRKKVRDFMRPHYTENFVQCVLDALAERDQLAGSTLVVGGDGRYYCEQAVRTIIQLAAANKVSKLIVGQHGILSTPAVSALIRHHSVLGGLVLTASHNPGGPDHDFGIKYNARNGGPAPDHFSTRVHELSESIERYRTVTPALECPVDTVGVRTFTVDGGTVAVHVIDSTECYVALMKEIFDFGALRSLLQSGRCNVLIDAMNGVTGPYVRRIFIDELGAGEDNCRRISPLHDFGGAHPDPNLTYAKELVDMVKSDATFQLGAAFDGDGDRNMIIGQHGFFISPSDSLAVIGNNLSCIPYFKTNPVKGFARSMPTAASIDRVAAALGQKVYEVPTGWKYFGNLMDAGKLSLCGEESFGTGSDHIREKDGIWAVLAWLSIMAHKNMGVEDIMRSHWLQFGRNYYTRYDYEDCDADSANKMMAQLETQIASKKLVSSTYGSGSAQFVIEHMDNFSYTDPIDQSIAKNQGIRVLFKCKSRLIFRLSGTGSSGATIRLYVELYEPTNIDADAQVVLRPLIDIALQISKLVEFTGRTAPTVIT